MSERPKSNARDEAKASTWLLAPKRAAKVAAVVAAALSLLLLTDFADQIETKFARVIEFQARTAAGRAPKLAPSIKVLAFEDRSAAALSATDLSIDQWSQVLTAIAARGPRVILIDKTFSHPLGASDARPFVEKLAKAGAPVVAKAHVTSVPLRYLTPLPVEPFAIPYEQLIRTSDGRVGMRARRPHWLTEKAYHPYGPLPALLGAFWRIGHNATIEEGYLRPLINVYDAAGGGRGLLHWSFYALGMSADGTPQHGIDGNALRVGKTEVLLDSQGRIPVNLLAFDACLERTRSIFSALDMQSRGQPLTFIEPNDTVVVLPDMHTGTIDFEDTPLGRIPIGFINLAAVNSVVTGNWLGTLGGYTPLTILLCFLGAMLAARPPLSMRQLGITLAFVTAGLIAALGVAAFVFLDWIVPWVFPTLGFTLSAVACHFEVIRSADRRAALLRHDLDGVLAPAKLQKMLNRKTMRTGAGDVRLEATEQVVTIMFIDIVGFSPAAEKQTPKEAFSSLKSLVDALRKTVHEFGGDVDRTMGDGMLCVFGYDVDGQIRAPRHADQAAWCAAKIQQDNMKRILKAQKTGQSVFPLRIGINTSGVYLGNLGDSRKLDFTVIGNGVNFAQRLETACDRHMVMIGASTRDLLSDFPGKEEMLRRRFIRVKHHDELVEAWELDPFWDDAQLLNDGDEAYREFIGVERIDTRWPVPYPGLIRVLTDYGDGELVNFSNDGFTIKLGVYYAKDVTIGMKLDSLDGQLGERLERAGLLPIVLEVRWARPAGDSYIHGCLIKNLTAEHREDIINMLRDSLHRYVASEVRTA